MRHFFVLLLTAWLLCAASAVAAPDGEAGRVVAYTAWDTTTLYLAVKVDDPLIVGEHTAPLGEPWQDDAVAVYLNFAPDDAIRINNHSLRVVVSAAGGATVQRGDNGVWRNEPGWFQASALGTIRYGVNVDGKLNDSTTTDRGYQVELGLAWDLLRVFPPIKQHDGDPTPTIGFALACYSRGETQSVSCWPHTLTEDDLGNPSTWGRLQFVQGMQPVASPEPLASATLIQGDIRIDGDMKGVDWMMAGVQTFPWRAGAVTIPVTPTRQTVPVVAAWYLLDTPWTAAHRPPTPEALGGAEQPAYHLQQLQQARRAGLDALAVVIPADPALRQRTRRRLSALVDALKDYDRAVSAQFYTDIPLLMPVVDFSHAAPAAGETVEPWLDDFYGLVPPQFRLMTSDAAGQWRYPALLVAPAAPTAALLPADLGSRLCARWGVPIGWMLDAAWPATPDLDGVLTRCAWETMTGAQLREGAMRTMLITPGFSATRKAFLPRRAGQTYATGWQQIGLARPDFILIHSWNDFARASEIAHSTTYGRQYLDATRTATIELAQQRGFGIRLLRHTLPAVVRAGATYPVELLLRNNAGTALLTRDGFRVDYRITAGERQLVSGAATDKLALMEFAAARLRFNLLAGIDRKHPLPPGHYQLHLDFMRNSLQVLNLPMTTKRLGTLVLPFEVGAVDTAQLVESRVPGCVTAGTAAPLEFQVRLPDSTRKRRVTYRARWVNETGEALPGESRLVGDGASSPGSVVVLRGATPSAPPPGWYRVRVEMWTDGAPPVTLGQTMVQVVSLDLRVQFLDIGLPATLADDAATVEVPVALRNPGAAWVAGDARITWQWLAADGRPLPAAAGAAPLTDNVKSGGFVSEHIQVTLPPGAGARFCAFGLEQSGLPAQLIASPIEQYHPVRPVLLRPARYIAFDLADYYNDWATLTEAQPGGVGLDGHGNAFPREAMLPDAADLVAGYPPDYCRGDADAAATATVGFHFGEGPHGNMVRAQGQTIELRAVPAVALRFIACRTGDENPLPVTLRYADGEQVTVPVNISNWLGESQFGEEIAWRTPYLRTAQGDDRYLEGTLFAYRLPLDSRRVLSAIVLPNQPSACLFAITLETAER